MNAEFQDFRLAQAFHEGRRQFQSSVEMNPYTTEAEREQWLQGRMSALGESLSRHADKAIVAVALLCPILVLIAGG